MLVFNLFESVSGVGRLGNSDPDKNRPDPQYLQHVCLECDKDLAWETFWLRGAGQDPEGGVLTQVFFNDTVHEDFNVRGVLPNKPNCLNRRKSAQFTPKLFLQKL
jgi:hypothetical protein